jgi:hypothetical protein
MNLRLAKVEKLLTTFPYLVLGKEAIHPVGCNHPVMWRLVIQPLRKQFLKSFRMAAVKRIFII